MLLTLEDRIIALEQENQALRTEIQATLASLQGELEVMSPRPGGERWSRRAWVLALLNLVLAVTLFVNVNYYSLDDLPPTMSAVTAAWLHGLWLALSFVWLILQLYPLALMFDAQESVLRQASWRNAGRLLVSNPALLGTLTGAVLVIALVSALAPTAWLWLVAAMTVVVAGYGLLRVLAPLFDKVTK